jgi:hypothetical protein
MEHSETHPQFVLCINDGGYVDDLNVGKVYQALPDESAARNNYLRIIDETGEDYLYPGAYFVPIEVPEAAEQVLVHASVPSTA